MFVSSPGPQIKVLLALGVAAAFDLRVMKTMQDIKSSKSFLNMFMERESAFSSGCFVDASASPHQDDNPLKSS